MRYFVTGATGFVGGQLVRQLRQAGHEIAALVRSPSRAGDLVAEGVTLCEGDVTDPASVRAGMQSADGVFHCAGWYRLGARDPAAATSVNVDGTRNVLQAMRDLGIAKGVYTSTVAVFSDTGRRMVDESHHFTGRHLTEYDRTKWQAHYEVALPMIEAGLPLVIVQPGVVYGPGDHSQLRDLLVQFLRRRVWMVPSRTAYAWSHVEDSARGHVLAMERGRTGESYILAGPAHTLIDALQIAGRLTGIRPPCCTVPPAIVRAMAVLMQGIGVVAPLPPTFHPETLRAIAGVTYLGNPTKAIRELGFTARPLEEGLRETLDYELKLLRDASN
jgi:dihydroflavonol-4-reductase